MTTQSEVDFATHLARFAESAGRLNQASNGLNSILKRIEKTLVDANAGVEAWLDLPLFSSDSEGSAHGPSKWTVELLGFAKVDGNWCLATKTVRHETGYFEGDLDSPYHDVHTVGEITALTQASRDLRIAALGSLPALVQQMTNAAEARIKTIAESKQLFQ